MPGLGIERLPFLPVGRTMTCAHPELDVWTSFASPFSAYINNEETKDLMKESLTLKGVSTNYSLTLPNEIINESVHFIHVSISLLEVRTASDRSFPLVGRTMACAHPELDASTSFSSAFSAYTLIIKKQKTLEESLTLNSVSTNCSRNLPKKFINESDQFIC